MVPNSAMTNWYVRMAGQESLVALAQGNLLNNLDRVRKVRTDTYLAHNGQTETGLSQNYGAVRHYTWEDTLIDCRNNPTLIESDAIKNFVENLMQNSRFKFFKDNIEQRAGDMVHISPFCYIMRGSENMRYNIRCESRIENFDIIRVGIKLSADDEELFKAAIKNIAGANMTIKSRTLHSIL